MPLRSSKKFNCSLLAALLLAACSRTLPTTEPAPIVTVTTEVPITEAAATQQETSVSGLVDAATLMPLLCEAVSVEDLDSFVAEVIEQTNIERAKVGAAPL